VLAKVLSLVTVQPTTVRSQWYLFLRTLNCSFSFGGDLWNIAAEGAYYSDASWGFEKCIIKMKRKSKQTR
jgi:hypothetical protein